MTTVGPEASLAAVLQLAYEKEYSQFPMIDEGGGFRGLVAENEITRWLGRQVGTKGTNVDLAEVAVKSVLQGKETDRKQIPIFRFESLQEPEAEVMGLFIWHPMLEVVLLTASGNKTSPIEGHRDGVGCGPVSLRMTSLPDCEPPGPIAGVLLGAKGAWPKSRLP